MKRWEYGELSVRVPDVPFVQIDTLVRGVSVARPRTATLPAPQGSVSAWPCPAHPVP